MGKPDNNFRSYAGVSNIVLTNEELLPDNPKQYADILKFSCADNCLVDGCRVAGGTEDSVDINNLSHSITVSNTALNCGDAQAVTIKGGSRDIHLSNVVIYGRGKYAEIELDNWSDQSRTYTTGIVLESVTHADGGPVRVVAARNRPTIIGGNCRIRPVWSLLVRLYCVFKGAF